MPSNAKRSPKADDYDAKKLHVEGLSQKERRVLITNAFQHLPHSLTYNEKIQHLAKRLQTNTNSVIQMGKRWKLREWDAEQRIDPTAPTETLTLLLQPDAKPFSTTAFVDELKQFTRRAVDASSRFTACTALMIEMYSQRLEAKVLATPSPSELDYKELEIIYERLSTYMNRAKSFMTPQAVASLLNAIRFADSIPPPTEGIEEGVTIHRLQATLIEMGAVSLLNNPEAATAVFDRYRDQIPDILGTR
jgi:hypothetical protein